MSARSEWKGFLQFSQLMVPVKAYSASSSQSDTTLNQLHRGCGERIRQQKICPLHGPVDSDAIMSGYQVAEGCYLPIESDELEQLKPDADKSLTIDCFIAPDAVDPVYHSGRTLYLVPDGLPGERPFAVLRDGMAANQRWAFSKVVLSRKEHLVLLRPAGKLLAMTLLEYHHRIRLPADYEGEVNAIHTGDRELSLIRDLITSMSRDQLDLSNFRDRYRDGLCNLIEQKVAEADLVSAPTPTAAVQMEEENDSALIALLEASLLSAGIRSGDTSPPIAPTVGAEIGTERQTA